MATDRFTEAWPDLNALPPTAAALALDGGGSDSATLLLRARQPSLLKLKGLPALRFRRFALAIQALPLQRNLALSVWGGQVYPADGGTAAAPETTLHVVLPGISSIDAIGLTTNFPAPGATAELDAANGEHVRLPVPLEPSGGGSRGLVDLQGDAAVVRIRYPARGSGTLLVRSPSLPADVMVELPDGTFLDVFVGDMQPGAPRLGRDLAEILNRAWQGDELTLRLTAVSDGVVCLQADGAWYEEHTTRLEDVRLEPGMPRTLPVAWPATWTEADVSVQVAGSLAPTRRLGLAAGASDFAVRVTEERQLAQLLRLPDSLPAIAGVWLALPHPPAAAEKLQLSLREGAGSSCLPGAVVAAGLTATLPSEPEAYVRKDGVCWLRVPLPAPLVWNSIQPLYLVAGGHGAGTLLAHRTEPDRVEHPAWVPANVQTALVCDLAERGAWEQVVWGPFAGTWLVDLDVMPASGEAQALLRLRVEGGESLALPGLASGDFAVETLPVRAIRSGSPQLVLVAESAVPAQLSGTIRLVRPVRS